MRAIGKLPKGVLILEFIGMMLLAVALLSVAKRLAPQLMNRPPQYSRSEREKDNDANH